MDNSGNGRYILEGRTPVLCPDLTKWARWFETAERRVRSTKINGNIHISTVFLGLDHSFGGNVPILFETMAFIDSKEDNCWRCSTWEEAVKQHQKAVQYLINTIGITSVREEWPEKIEEPGLPEGYRYIEI